VSLEPYALHSWSADYQELPPAAVPILGSTPATVSALLASVRERLKLDPGAGPRASARRSLLERSRIQLEHDWAESRSSVWDARPMHLVRLVGELWSALADQRQNVTLVRAPLAWPAGAWDFADPLAYLGFDGGAGVGAGPGLAVGAALGLMGSGRLAVAILGDGDLLMANTALWTAAHHRIPLLFVVANNRTYLNDEAHQTRVAQTRDRPVENRGVGQRMDDPPVDFAALARSMGVEAIGPVEDPGALRDAYVQMLRIVLQGRPALVDVIIGRDGA
jgi:thiamine pyrophosphate-dependent acetolactate synthase large subunit-like protein